jgi:hypothetical protein
MAAARGMPLNQNSLFGGAASMVKQQAVRTVLDKKYLAIQK